MISVRTSRIPAVIFAALLAVVAFAPAALAAQETKFNSVKTNGLWYGGDRVGRMTAVVDATARRDNPGRSWDNQTKIDLSPFRPGGSFFTQTSSSYSAASRICSFIEVQAKASNNLSGTSAPFGDIPLALDSSNTSRDGRWWILKGYKCRNINAYSAGINIPADNAFIWFGGRSEVDAIRIFARTTVAWGTHVLRTNWASDTINFD